MEINDPLAGTSAEAAVLDVTALFLLVSAEVVFVHRCAGAVDQDRPPISR